MSIKQRLTDDIKTAMKAKDNVTRDILRLIKNEIINGEKDALREFTEKEQIEVVIRYRKTVEDQIATAKEAGRIENVAKFENELEIVMKYLPKQLTESEVRTMVQAIITEGNYEGKKDLGKVMKEISPKTKGAFDGKIVNQIVVEMLG